MSTVWIYWDPPADPPAYFDFCLAQIKKYAGFPVEVVDHSEAIKLGCDLPPNGELPFKAHYADMVRAQLIHKYGGITMDADALVMPPFFDFYTDAIAKYKAFGPKDARGFFVYGLYSAPGEKWSGDWVAAQHKAYRTSRRDWLAFGAPLLWNISYPAETGSFSLSLSELVPWNEIARLLDKDKLVDLLSIDAPFICLFNKGLSRLTGGQNIRSLVTADNLLGQLLRYSNPKWYDHI